MPLLNFVEFSRHHHRTGLPFRPVQKNICTAREYGLILSPTYQSLILLPSAGWCAIRLPVGGLLLILCLLGVCAVLDAVAVLACLGVY